MLELEKNGQITYSGHKDYKQLSSETESFET